jgi:MoxR-like ATPase
MARGDRWTEDEYVVVLELYLRRGPVQATDPEVIDLASRIGRTPNAIYMRNANYQHVDPKYHGKGLDGGGAPVQRIWDKYADDPNGLQQAFAEALPRLEARAASRLFKEPDTSPQEAYLLTWNPKHWSWDELADVAHAVQAGLPLGTGTGNNRWSVTTKKVRPGDRLFVIRVGKNPKGIFASALATSEVYSDAHWSGEPGKTALYVDLKWEDVLAPDQPLLPLEVLKAEVNPGFSWTPQNSGLNIPVATAQKLGKRWALHLESPEQTNPRWILPSDQAPPKSFTIDDVVEDLFYDPEEVQGWLEVLRQKKNLVLQGPPGVGKTLIARRLAFGLLGEVAEAQVEWLQFHQSYSYEDFVQGWRPAKTGFDLQPGRFLQFCNTAAREPGKLFVLVIDEINRGNLSRIFGEALSLLEADKRGTAHALTLSYHSTDAQKSESSQRFSVPENLYLIGMMNTADRSLAMVDYALRRRFSFVSLSPQFGTDRYKEYLETRGVPKSLIAHIVASMEVINKEICDDQRHLGAGYRIGHSFFCPPSGLSGGFDSWFAGVVEHEILPLLQEYWIDADDKLAKVRNALKYVNPNS